MLPIAQVEPDSETYFEKYFAMPQSVNLFSLCKAYGVEHHLITEAKDFIDRIQTLPAQGFRVLEVVCDRKKSTLQRKTLLTSL